MHFPNSAALFKALINELKETAKAFGYAGLTTNQKANLCYAFAQIQSRSVDELAVVIALGLQQKPMHEVVDRYIVSRASGIMLFSSYNEIRGMNNELTKTWGVLLYKEQVQHLLEELSGCAYGKLPSTILLDRTELVKRLKVTYKTNLNDRDIDTLHNDLLIYTRLGMNSERWCVGMADKIIKVSCSSISRLS